MAHFKRIRPKERYVPNCPINSKCRYDAHSAAGNDPLKIPYRERKKLPEWRHRYGALQTQES